MPVIPSATGDIRLAHTGVFTVAGDAVTFAFDAGSDSNRHMVISVTWHGGSAHALGDSAVTFNGDAATPLGATVSSSNGRKRTYELTAPDTGSHTVSVDPDAGFGSDAPCIIEVYCYSGVDQTTPSDGYVSATGASAESAVNVTSATGDLVWTSHGGQSNNVASGTASGFTERLDTAIDSGTVDIAAVSGDADGATTVNTGVTWNTAVNWVAHGLNLNAAAAAGPTIDTQPVADTVLINGDAARRTGVFTVEATGTGTLSYQWQEDDGGGFANIADGGIYAGATTATLTITPTDKTENGFDYRCNVTDDNGTTASDGAAMTVYTGPVLSASSGTTNASGVSTVDITSDYPNADGEFTVVTATAGSVTKQVALHYETPA